MRGYFAYFCLVLQKLDITKNDVKALPALMGELHKLECLYAQHNDITEFPSFSGCTALREILIANNFLKVELIELDIIIQEFSSIGRKPIRQ